MYDVEIWVPFSDRIRCYTHGQIFILVVFFFGVFLWIRRCQFFVGDDAHCVDVCYVMLGCGGGRVRGTCKKSSLGSRFKKP